MRYSIEWMQNRGNLIEASLKGLDGEVFEKVTIWKTDKKTNVVFPNFDTLRPGDFVEGQTWTNPTNGSVTLYPPKPAGASKPKGNGFNATKVMAEKKEAVREAQERKEDSIMIASTNRMAMDVIMTLKPREENLRDMFLKWRAYFRKVWYADPNNESVGEPDYNEEELTSVEIQ